MQQLQLEEFLRAVPVDSGPRPLGPDTELDTAGYLTVGNICTRLQAQVDEALLTCKYNRTNMELKDYPSPNSKISTETPRRRPTIPKYLAPSAPLS